MVVDDLKVMARTTENERRWHPEEVGKYGTLGLEYLNKVVEVAHDADTVHSIKDSPEDLSNTRD